MDRVAVVEKHVTERYYLRAEHAQDEGKDDEVGGAISLLLALRQYPISQVDGHKGGDNDKEGRQDEKEGVTHLIGAN